MLKVRGSLLCYWTQVSKKGRILSPRTYSSQSIRWRILSEDNTRHLSFSHRQWETKRFKECDQKHKKHCFVRNWHPVHFCLLSKLMPSSCRTENSPHFPCSESQGLLLWSESHCFSLSLNSSTRNQVKMAQKNRLDKEGKGAKKKGGLVEKTTFKSDERTTMMKSSSANDLLPGQNPSWGETVPTGPSWHTPSES